MPPPPPLPTAMGPFLNVCTCFYLGFSTGHVGTTTLSSPKTYISSVNSHNSVHFFFEPAHFVTTTPTTIAEEEKFVREKYLVEMAKKLRGKSPGICIDLSHLWLSFRRGLIEVLRDTGMPMKIIRIRRDSYEVAESFEADPGHNRASNCVASAGFCPGVSADLILAEDIDRVWRNWSMFQRALWMADETEAQWLRLKNTLARGNILEIEWHKTNATKDGDQMSDVVDVVARQFGLRPAPDGLLDHKSHNHRIETAQLEERHCSELHEYRRDLPSVRGPEAPALDDLPSATATCPEAVIRA